MASGIGAEYVAALCLLVADGDLGILLATPIDDRITSVLLLRQPSPRRRSFLPRAGAPSSWLSPPAGQWAYVW